MTSSLMNDPYRDWLRKTLSPEMGLQKADQLVLGAVTRRGWPTMQAFGPREVVAVLQDVYASLREDMGDARADKWIEAATQSLSVFMQSVPAPVTPASGTQEPVQPVRAPAKWGRRAHDLPLLLARVHNETAQRSLDAIRVTPELSGLERAAEWDVQATHAELRRWEAEDKLSTMRADHSQSETSEQVRSARVQERLLDLTVRELEAEIRASAASKGAASGWKTQSGAPSQKDASLQTQLAHNRLMLSQTRAFLEVFAPLADEQGADTPAEMPDTDLEAQRLSVNVQLHPNVLRARHLLNYAEWQHRMADPQAANPQAIGSQATGSGLSGPTETEVHPRILEARQVLAHAEAEAAQLLQSTLNTARQHQEQWLTLQARLLDAERRVTRLSKIGGDPLSLARVQFEAQQIRAAMRINANRLTEALGLLNALSGT